MRKNPEKADVNAALDELRRDFDRLERARNSMFVGFGATDLATTASDRYLNPLSPGVAISGTELFLPAPRAGTIVGLNLHLASVGTAAADRTVTVVVRRKGVDTPVKVQFTVPKFSGELSSRAVGAVKVERNDLLSVVVRKSGVLTGAPGPIVAFVEIE